MDEYWLWLGRAADFATIIALAVTVYVAWKVRSLQNRIIARGRAPELEEQLSRLASELVGQLSDFTTRENEIRKTLVDILACVQTLLPKVPREFRRELEETRDAIKRFVPIGTATLTDDSCRRIYWQVSLFLQRFKEHLKDERLRVEG